MRTEKEEMTQESDEASYDSTEDEYILSESEEDEGSYSAPSSFQSPFQIKVFANTSSCNRFSNYCQSPTLVIEKEEPIQLKQGSSEQSSHSMRRSMTRQYSKDVSSLLEASEATNLLDKSTRIDLPNKKRDEFKTPIRRARKFSARSGSSASSSSSSKKDSSISSLMEYLTFYIHKAPSLNASVEERFLRQYLNFMYENKPRAFPSPFPMWRSVPLDLFHLFLHVQKKGGFDSMDRSDWNEVYSFLRNYSSLVKNAGRRLKLADETSDTLEKFKDSSESLQLQIITNIKKKSLKELPESAIDQSAATTLEQTQQRSKSVVDGTVFSESSNINKSIFIGNAYLQLFKQNQSTSIVIKIGIFDTPAGKTLFEQIPIVMTSVVTFGSTLLMTTDVDPLNDSLHQDTSVVLENGELAYSVTHGSIVLAFGSPSQSVNDECRLPFPFEVFGKINDSDYTFDKQQKPKRYLPQILSVVGNESEVWCAKLLLNNPLKLSGESIHLRKKIKHSTVGNNISENSKAHRFSTDTSTSFSMEGERMLTIRYRYEGETEQDARLVSNKYTPLENVVDLQEIHSVLRRDNVNIELVSEIRYFKEGKDIDHCGWVILPPSFVIELKSPETMLKLLLKRTSSSHNSQK
ncbi:hypothetical protein C9374_002969 [Naegleria lovaniensis]|uniref:ARID domain-containing protein n=1 Tax=Naegleria lovaniensis TaxID=51637 RepID=A0AA88GN93_NAELO|nr:uncharacterized protein C9374_002969 [Naegleria lovaniensis]KAG2385820.1 hypothetical protein C9374_002969 [Naegleria lovaniensis]